MGQSAFTDRGMAVMRPPLLIACKQTGSVREQKAGKAQWQKMALGHAMHCACYVVLATSWPVPNPSRLVSDEAHSELERVSHVMLLSLPAACFRVAFNAEDIQHGITQAD